MTTNLQARLRRLEKAQVRRMQSLVQEMTDEQLVDVVPAEFGLSAAQLWALPAEKQNALVAKLAKRIQADLDATENHQ